MFFEKSKHFATYQLKAFSSDTPQSIKPFLDPHSDVLCSAESQMKKILVKMLQNVCFFQSHFQVLYRQNTVHL